MASYACNVAIWNSKFSCIWVYRSETHSTLKLFNRYLFICWTGLRP